MSLGKVVHTGAIRGNNNKNTVSNATEQPVAILLLLIKRLRKLDILSILFL